MINPVCRDIVIVSYIAIFLNKLIYRIIFEVAD